MLKRLIALVFVPLMMGCSAGSSPGGSSANANPWPKAYQAVFAVPAGASTIEQRQYSDGNGRIRLDVPFQGTRRAINVYDLRKQEKLGWTDGTGEYLSEPLKTDELPYFSAERLQAMGGSSLGEKVIDGRSCRGFGGPQSEIWVDVQYGLPVLSTAGGASIKMTSFSPTSPDPSLFEVPSDYHKMIIPK